MILVSNDAIIIFSNDSGKIKWPKADSHDPDSEKYYYITFYPATRANSTAYTKGVDVVVPATNNGCMYVCTSGGISGSSAPTFATIEGEETTDGDVTWTCYPLTAKLGPSDSITAATWTGDTGVTLTDDGISGGTIVYVKVTSVPSNVSSFEITVAYTITRSDARTEIFNKTLVIPIKEL